MFAFSSRTLTRRLCSIKTNHEKNSNGDNFGGNIINCTPPLQSVGFGQFPAGIKVHNIS